MTGTVSVSITGHVAELRFANPPHNHVNAALLAKIADAVDALDADAAVRAIVLASEGRIFCAGADLNTSDWTGTPDADPVRLLYGQALRLFARKKPIIAAVQGAAVGAGLGLAVCADFRVAGPDARFSANFVRLGFHPGFGLTHSLPRLIGEQRSSEMMLGAARIKADQALAWGLADRMAADPIAGAHAMAIEIADNAPLSLLSTRATITGDLVANVRTAMDVEHAAQALLRETHDYDEGVASVFERRPANFLGR